MLYYPRRPKKEIYEILVTQCEKLRLPFLSSLPPAPEIDDHYQVVVDAIFGFGFKGTTVKDPFNSILTTLKEVKVPIASVDVPSGNEWL